MNDTRIALLADEVRRAFAQTELGHCARVDFLDRDEALAVRDHLATGQAVPSLLPRLLRPTHGAAPADDRAITTDEAIEIRNRKSARLCLFVPTDLVDAAVSSLANSFAPIDGRDLHRAALARLQADLSPAGSRLVRSVFAALKRPLRASDDQRLDYAAAILQLDGEDRLAEAGRELWRVGLIADVGPDFVANLTRNRRAALKLSRPARLLASTAERIQSTGVDATTAAELARFFRARPLHDVRAWSRALVESDGHTFGRWDFPQEDPSDLKSVTVRPFRNTEGKVEPYTKLAQPDGAGGSLLARCGPKQTLAVRWVSDPPKPSNLSRWLVEIVPSGTEAADGDIDLPAREVPGTRGTVTLKLDLDLDPEALPDFGVVVRVTALDASGSPIAPTGEHAKGEETPVTDDSDEFFLVLDAETTPDTSTRESRRTVPTLAFGRLEAAVEAREDSLTETQPQWLSKEQEYFSLRLNERRTLNIALSATLRDLQRQILAAPRRGGCFTLNVAEIRPAAADDCVPHDLPTAANTAWEPFWRAREAFFVRLIRVQARSAIEAADWTPELAGAAQRYGQAYRELLDDLVANDADLVALREALSVDTLLVRIAAGGPAPEEALVILPTHPLRAAWFAGYTQLLRGWETQLLAREPRLRERAVDREALRALAPTNVPAFAFHAASPAPFAFFQNLRFFHGVALPAGVPDPHRRYADLGIVLGSDPAQATVGDLHPERLAEHLTRFRALHPYAENLIVTLVNPDRGDFFAEALVQSLGTPGPARPDDDEQAEPAPTTWNIVAYVEDPRASSLQALDRVRHAQSDAATGRPADNFLPRLATSVRPSAELVAAPPPDAHLAVVADFTQPRITTTIPSADTTAPGGTSLYGLVTRFVPELLDDGEELRWHHRIATDSVGRPEPHPAGPRFGDTLVDLHLALLRAGGKALGGLAGAVPILEVRLAADRRRLLELLHQNSNWVVTLDRFFALDYYDSPRDPRLQDLARTYVLDYSPEFAEGLGHRLLVTTAWRDEIGALLARAMDELGFAAIDESVSRLLHHLKTVSGRLALQSLESANSAAAIVGLGVVAAWLQGRGRLQQAVLLPVDLHPRLFSQRGFGALAPGERRCDLVLFALKRNIVEATFIEVKWRRGRAPLEDLANDMVLQMVGSAEALRARFFDDDRVDGALQRAYLANVLRFYFERAQRYGLFDPAAAGSFLEHLTRLEKTGLQFKQNYEGYIVSLDREPHPSFPVGEARITILTAADFESATAFTATRPSFTIIPDAEQPSTGPGDEDRSDSTASDLPSEPAEPIRPENGTVTDSPPHAADSMPVIASTEDPPATALAAPTPPPSLHIPLGEALDGPLAWTPSTQGSPHLFIIGIPGQGKSWTVTRILSELGAQGVPALVLDFHGQFADPASPFVRRAHPVILDAAAGLPFSPFECSRDGNSNEWKAYALAVSEIFGYVAGLGDMQRDVVYQAIGDAYRAAGFGDPTVSIPAYPTLADVLGRIEERERPATSPTSPPAADPCLRWICSVRRRMNPTSSPRFTAGW